MIIFSPLMSSLSSKRLSKCSKRSPEIPVNIYELGLVYKIDFTPDDETLHVDMTLTAPSCPAADFILEDVRQKLLSVPGPKKVDLRLVFEPEWNQDMMSEEAKLELGFL